MVEWMWDSTGGCFENDVINAVLYTSFSGPDDYQAKSALIKRYTPTTNILVCPRRKQIS